MNELFLFHMRHMDLLSAPIELTVILSTGLKTNIQQCQCVAGVISPSQTERERAEAVDGENINERIKKQNMTVLLFE